MNRAIVFVDEKYGVSYAEEKIERAIERVQSGWRPTVELWAGYGADHCVLCGARTKRTGRVIVKLAQSRNTIDCRVLVCQQCGTVQTEFNKRRGE